MKADFEEITRQLIAFRDERDWAQFHNSKDLALAISVEAAELLELFLWQTPEKADPEKISEELADILAYAFLLAERYHLDIPQIMISKIRANALKYPVNTSMGSARKYNQQGS
ncbi:MAG TPA: nucleotide pyrophosphohydrolase [Chitinophagaceae bacterium]|nr:nucleotide pyrophosphohydrolase [Chitinophagaceae bacterium]